MYQTRVIGALLFFSYGSFLLCYTAFWRCCSVRQTRVLDTGDWCSPLLLNFIINNNYAGLLSDVSCSVSQTRVQDTGWWCSPLLFSYFDSLPWFDYSYLHYYRFTKKNIFLNVLFAALINNRREPHLENTKWPPNGHRSLY